MGSKVPTVVLTVGEVQKPIDQRCFTAYEMPVTASALERARVHYYWVRSANLAKIERFGFSCDRSILLSLKISCLSHSEHTAGQMRTLHPDSAVFSTVSPPSKTSSVRRSMVDAHAA